MASAMVSEEPLRELAQSGGYPAAKIVRRPREIAEQIAILNV
jgi:hypothetical protein